MTRIVVTSVISLLILSGCSSPAGLDRVLNSFADAADNNKTALAELDETSARRITEIRQKRAIDGADANGERVLIRPLARANCSFDAPGCEIRLMTQSDAQSGADDAGSELNVASLIPNQLAVAREIATYASGLKETAAADNTDELKAGVSSAMEGVCGLAGTLAAFSGVGVVAKPACGAFQASVASLAAFVYGEYQTQAKLSALRAATRDMQPLLVEAAAYFSTSAGFAIDGDVRRFTEQYDKALGNWETERSEKNLEALLQAASRLDTALKARAELGSEDSVFHAFATAHGKIVSTLNRSSTDLSTAIAEVENLVQKTKNLVAIAREFKKAAEAQGESAANDQ